MHSARLTVAWDVNGPSPCPARIELTLFSVIDDCGESDLYPANRRDWFLIKINRTIGFTVVEFVGARDCIAKTPTFTVTIFRNFAVHTLGPACNEHQAVTRRFLCINIIDCKVKMFSYNEQPLITSSFFCVFLLVVTRTQCSSTCTPISYPSPTPF